MIKRITKQQDRRKKREAEYEKLGITEDMREEMGLGDDSDSDSISSGAESGSDFEGSEDSASSSLAEALAIEPVRRKKKDEKKSRRRSAEEDTGMQVNEASSEASSSEGDPEASTSAMPRKTKANTLKHLNVPDFMTRRKSGTRSCVLCEKPLTDASKKSDVVQQHLKSATHRRRLLYFKTKIIKRLNQTGDTSVAIERAEVIRKIVRDVSTEGKAAQKKRPEEMGVPRKKASKKAVPLVSGQATAPQAAQSQAGGLNTGKKRRRARRQKKDKGPIADA